MLIFNCEVNELRTVWDSEKQQTPNSFNESGFSNIIFFKLPWKNPKSPNDWTEEGIVNDSNDEHSWKALLPIDTTDEGIKTFFKFWQFEKAFFPIFIIELGIAIYFNSLEFSKSPSSISLFFDNK